MGTAVATENLTNLLAAAGTKHRISINIRQCALYSILSFIIKFIGKNSQIEQSSAVFVDHIDEGHMQVIQERLQTW